MQHHPAADFSQERDDRVGERLLSSAGTAVECEGEHLNVFLNFNLVVQYHIGIQGHSRHFIFTGIDGHGGDPFHVFFDAVDDGFAVGDAAGKDDGVNLAFQHAGIFADLLGHLISESLFKKFGFRVAGDGRFLHSVSVVAAEVADITAFADEHFLHVLLGVFAAETGF